MKTDFKENKCLNCSLLTRKLPLQKAPALETSGSVASGMSICCTLRQSWTVMVAMARAIFQFPAGFSSERVACVCLLPVSVPGPYQRTRGAHYNKWVFFKSFTLFKSKRRLLAFL